LSFVLCPLSFVLCPLSLVLGPWSLVLGPSSFVLRPWSFVLCPSSFVPGPWSLVLGPWSFVLRHLSFVFSRLVLAIFVVSFVLVLLFIFCLLSSLSRLYLAHSWLCLTSLCESCLSLCLSMSLSPLLCFFLTCHCVRLFVIFVFCFVYDLCFVYRNMRERFVQLGAR
jgi:hypothetical protein